jgi:predicted DNA binding CopG/RHH family protein
MENELILKMKETHQKLLENTKQTLITKLPTLQMLKFKKIADKKGVNYNELVKEVLMDYISKEV